MKNGKGKEYFDNGYLKYEGEYLNGMRNGKGKLYYHSNGKLFIEGFFKNGIRNKIYKKYSSDSELIYEGEYSCWKKS